MTDETPDAAAAAAGQPEAPDPEGVDASALEPGVWYEGRLEELHAEVIAVSFEKKGGGRFTLTIDRPRWNCDPASFQVGDPIHVRLSAPVPFAPAG